MNEPCISNSIHNYNCFLYDTKEELQQLQVTQGKHPIKYIFLIQLAAITEVVPSSGG